MFHTILELPWPDWRTLFTATVMIVLLQPARILIAVLFKHIMPESRIERNLIIKLHTRNQHVAPLNSLYSWLL